MAPIKEKRIGGTEKRADSLLHYTCKYRVKFTFSTGIKDNNLSSEGGSCRLCGSHFDITVWIVWIQKAMTPAFGTRSCSSCNRLVTAAGPNMVTPVALPPGRLRLSTRPSLTGSPNMPNTIGIV